MRIVKYTILNFWKLTFLVTWLCYAQIQKNRCKIWPDYQNDKPQYLKVFKMVNLVFRLMNPEWAFCSSTHK